jgi:C4-dicarboxylate-specific signal transduction histidine kinase
MPKKNHKYSQFLNSLSREDLEIIASLPTENPNPVFRLSAEGDVLYQNPVAEEFLSTFQKDSVKWIHFKNFFQSTLRDFTSKVYFLSLSGFNYQIRVVPSECSEAVNFYVADITELRKIERELLQLKAEQAQRSRLASLGEMAAAIAHEVNNPLAIIQTLTERVQRKLRSDEPSIQEITKLNDEIIQTTQRVAQIIKTLGVFSRDASKEGFQEFSLKKAIDDLLTFTGEKIKKMGIVLKLSVPEDIFLQGRLVEVEQVFLNLLSNSIHALKGEPIKWISIAAIEESGFVFIRFIDSGPGLSPQAAQRLFQPFYTTKSPGEGAGISLSVSAKIISQHDGELNLDTNSHNTCFCIRMPGVIKKAEVA